jgi:hypothetical protein
MTARLSDGSVSGSDSVRGRRRPAGRAAWSTARGARAAALVVSLVGALTVALSAAVVAPASAVPGLNRVSATSAFNSNVFKAITVNCQPGQFVTGGGASIGGGTTEVAVTRFAPLAGGTGFEAQAYEDRDGFAGGWSLTVYAICANPLAGYEINQVTSPVGSPALASATVGCSAGKRLLGTGGGVSPGRGVVILTGAIPVGTPPTGTTAIGEETEGGFTGGWTVTAWAICALPVAGHSVAMVSSVFDSTSPKGASASCPAGTAAHGTGVLIRNGLGEVYLNAVVPAPAGVPTAVRSIGFEDQTGYAGNWFIRSYAICAT